MPCSVATIGVQPETFLRKGLLWHIFGVPNVRALPSDPLDIRLSPDTAIVVGDPLDLHVSWKAFSDWVGPRHAVVDVHAAVMMANADGHAIRLATDTGTTDGVLDVFQHQIRASVYPGAPRVRVTAESEHSLGFAVGNIFHAYAWDERGLPVLRGVIADDAWQRFLTNAGGNAWGETVNTGNPALISMPTPGGGTILICDLHAIDRSPEPSGAETPALHVFLNGLGRGSITFGSFTVPYREYEAFVEAVRALTLKHRHVAQLLQIGVSSTGLPIWMLKVLGGSTEPAVLMTAAIHSLEWGPVYGILRYVQFLMESLDAGTPYAQEVLGNRQLWWVLSANPDGWVTRDQEARGINLNRNFPGTWETCIPTGRCWDTYCGRFAPVHPGALKARGPAPGSEAETQALMHLLSAGPAAVATLADFHETTAADSFLHQHEEPDGTLADLLYHQELVEGLGLTFNGRFLANVNRVSFGPALSDFETYHLETVKTLPRLIPSGVSGWQRYAVSRGLKGVVVEAAGADCTHYHTIRRTEFAALAAEQVLSAEEGRLVRNPLPEARDVRLTLHRMPSRITGRVYDADDNLVDSFEEEGPSILDKSIPPGGWLRIRNRDSQSPRGDDT